MDLPEANVFDWITGNGGVLSSKGDGLDGKKVGVIGGGQTGLAIASLLSCSGAEVMVWEADDNLQGRAKTHVFPDGNKAPMGMMRWGRGESIFSHLVQELGFVMKEGFPDPGVVPTLVHYDSETVLWPTDQAAPPGFEKVQADFLEFLSSGWCGLTAWSAINESLRSGHSQVAVDAIQGWINVFDGVTFGEAIRTIFDGIWGEEEFKKFDTLGVGSGGFGVINQKSVLAVMRVIVNGYEDRQCSLGKHEGGVLRNAFPDEFIDALEEHATGCDVDIRKSTPVVSVKEKDKRYLVTTSDGSTFTVNIVVCTTMLRSMIRIEGLPELLGSIYEEERDLPADMRSGKLFAVSNITGVSEYDNKDFPKMLLGEVNHQSVQMYVQDGVESDGARTCTLLLWYGWQESYDYLAGLSDDEILQRCLEIAKTITANTKYERVWQKIFRNVTYHEALRWQGHKWAGSAFSMPDPEDNYKLRQALFSWGSGGRISENDVFAAMADLGGGGGWNEQGYELLAVVYSAILKKHGRLFCEQKAPCNLLSYNTLQFRGG